MGFKDINFSTKLKFILSFFIVHIFHGFLEYSSYLFMVSRDRQYKLIKKQNLVSCFCRMLEFFFEHTVKNEFGY